VSGVAADQWGVIADWQLRKLDVSYSAMWRWVNSGLLYEKYPGVFAVGHAGLPREGELLAALFYAGAGAALSHLIGAWWWKLTIREPEVIEISIPRSRTRSAPGVVFHRRRDFERTHHRRLPVTTLPQTLRDYAATKPLHDVRYVLAEAEYHHGVDLDAVAAACRRGAPGSGRLHQALKVHDARLALTDSELERELYALAEAGGVPRPVLQAKPCGFRVDAYWPKEGVVVEVDGYNGHHTPAQLADDHGRDLTLRRARLIPLRYARAQIKARAPEVVDDLRSAIYKTGIYQR
jgi:very-short-patch-repair endonuclease